MRNFSDSFMNRLCSFSFPLCVSPLLPFYLYFLRSSLLMSCSSVGYHSTREEKKSTHTESPAYHSFSSSISPLILPLRLSSCSLHLSRHPHSLLLFSSARSCCCFLILFILLVKFGPVLTWVRWGLWILAFEYADMFSLTWQLSFTVRPHTQDAHGHTRRSRERISPPPPTQTIWWCSQHAHRHDTSYVQCCFPQCYIPFITRSKSNKVIARKCESISVCFNPLWKWVIWKPPQPLFK